jgi:uncharacterized protein
MRFIAVLLIAAASSPAVAADINIAVQGPVIELTVNQQVAGNPDFAEVGAGVQTRAQTAVEAARLNAVQMERVVARLKALGIKADEIQTRAFSVQPQFTYQRDGAPPVFTGYLVENHVVAKLRKLDQAGPALDALIAAGANSIDGPNFMLENDTAAKTAARKAAFATAQRQARELAGLAGFGNVRLLELSESYVAARTINRDEIVVTGSRIKGASTPIEPGQVQTGVTLTVKYEMTR